jgi:4-carboxymuconolactone decarboxylase
MNRELFAVLACILISMFTIASIPEAQIVNNKGLNAKQEQIVTIAAFTAKGDLDKLKTALNEGLDAGLTVNEIKEILVQLYAYAGFPRSLNGIGTFMNVIDEREKKGIKDEIGREASPLPTDKNSIEFGTENQTKLIGHPVTGPLYDFVPAIDRFLKAHLFGDIFQRDVVNWQDRELATVSALANIEGVNAQLQGHMVIGLHNGLTPEQLREFVSLLRVKCGPKVAENAGIVLDQVLNQSMEKNMSQQQDDAAAKSGIFPRGKKNEAYAQYFTGTSYLNMLSTERIFIGNVTFEPGCRNFWVSVRRRASFARSRGLA